MKKVNILSAVACILGLMVSHASAFATGFNMSQPAVLGIHCSREASARAPFHFAEECGGACRSQNQFSSPFALEVNADEYWDGIVRVVIRPRFQIELRGFTVAAVSDGGVVGEFADSLDRSYISHQCPSEGFFAMHMGPPQTRDRTPMNMDGSVMLGWQGGGQNHGNINFVVYAVANVSMFWYLESHTLFPSQSAEETTDIAHLFMNIVEDTFDVRSVFSDSGSHVGFERRTEGEASLSNDTLTEDGNETLADGGNETLADGGNSTMKDLPLNGAENGTFLTEKGEIIPTLEEFENGFMKRLQGGFNLDRPFNTFDRDEFTIEDFEVHDLDEDHFDPFDGVETPEFNPNANMFNPANPFGPNGPMGPFGPFGPNSQNPFAQNPFGPGQNPFGQNGPNQFGPGQNQFGPGQNQFGPGQNQFGPGQNQFGPGQNQFGPGQNQFGPGQNQFGPGQNQFGPGQNQFGPGQNQFGPGQNQFGPGQNPFGQNGPNQFGQNGPNQFGQNGPNQFGQGGPPFGGQPGGPGQFGGQPGGPGQFGGQPGGGNQFGGRQGMQSPFGGPQGMQSPFGGQPGGGNQFGGQPGGGNPFGGQPGGGNPFGGQPGGGNPFGGQPGGGNPFGGQPGGGNPFGGGGGPFGGGGGRMPMGMFPGGGGRMQQQASAMVQQNPNSVFSLLTG